MRIIDSGCALAVPVVAIAGVMGLLVLIVLILEAVGWLLKNL